MLHISSIVPKPGIIGGQIAGVDFQSRFTSDNFASRRTTGHNMLDPESLMSGGEIQRGMTYRNSRRVWRDEAHYLAAVSGELTTDEILEQAPRVLVDTRTGVVDFDTKTITIS